MATTRPPGGGATPQARLGIDLSQFQSAPAIARAAGQATAREISNAFKTIHNEQRLAQTQAQQTLAVLRAQQSQITATTRAESQVRIQQARAEAQVQQQAARTAAATRIEEERRITAQVRSELRMRETAARQAAIGGQGGMGAGTLLAGARGVAGAFGIGLGVAGAVQAGRALVESTQTATAYDRQRLAALNLAGSQRELNELMVAYGRASGGAVDKAAALANVTRLQAVGFADNAQEVEIFTRAVRGSSIAMGRLQDEISQEVQLAISNQSLRRLDQIGLGITEVNDRIAELRASNIGMTREAAFQEAVLGLLNEKFGALSDSAVGQATGVERLTRAWADLRLEMGKAAQGPVDTIAGRLAGRVDATAEVISIERARQAANRTGVIPGGLTMETNVAGAQAIRDNLIRAHTRVLEDIAAGARPAAQTGPLLEELNAKIRAASISVAGLSAQRLLATGDLPQGAPDIRDGASPAASPRFKDEQVDIMVEREATLTRIARDADRAIVESAAQFAQQRSQTIANFEKSIAREAEDFGRQRLNAERKLGLSILDVHQDSARQRVRWEADLARTLEEQRIERDERISESREAATERLAEIEEKHNKDREKRQRDFVKNIREAAANLDAVQLRELQRQNREENQEAKDAHQERIADEQKSLQKRIDDANKAYAKQEAEQRAALDRRIQQQAEDDRLRIDEMKAAFAAQTAQEDEERAIRLGRQAEDHAAQLAEMDRAQGERIQQIKDQEAESLAEQERAYDLRLQAEGVHNAKLEAEQRRHRVIAEANYAAHLDALDEIARGRTQGPQPQNPFITPGQFPSLVQPGAAGVGSVSNSRAVNITINVPGGTSLGAQELYNVAYGAATDALADTLEAYQ